MSKIAQLLTPQHIYSNIFEHVRSHLAVAILDSDDIKGLEITSVQVAAFGTRYHFSLDMSYVKKAPQSTLLIIPDQKEVGEELIEESYLGYLEETLEPGASRPTFNFQIKKQ